MQATTVNNFIGEMNEIIQRTKRKAEYERFGTPEPIRALTR